jgi:N-terminal TM domain of oligopeptide transport permease C
MVSTKPCYGGEVGREPSRALRFVLIVAAALFGPHIAPYDPLDSNTPQALKPPSSAHWFGTDQLGRNVLDRVMVATRLDLTIAIASVVLVFLMGGLAGVAAGFFGGWTELVVSRVADTIMAFPLFVLAMGIVAALGSQAVLDDLGWTGTRPPPRFARYARRVNESHKERARQVGLPVEFLDRFPHQLWQKAHVGIARAIPRGAAIVRPRHRHAGGPHRGAGAEAARARRARDAVQARSLAAVPHPPV